VGIILVANSHPRPRRPVDYRQICAALFEQQKKDFCDAEAIVEAVQRPTIKFVAINSVTQMDLHALHRVLERRVSNAPASSPAPRLSARAWHRRPQRAGHRPDHL
jgi:transposase